MKRKTVQTKYDLSLIHIFPNEVQKLDIYKRIADIQTDEETEEMLEELILSLIHISGVTIGKGSVVRDSIIMKGTQIGENVVIDKARCV